MYQIWYVLYVTYSNNRTTVVRWCDRKIECIAVMPEGEKFWGCPPPPLVGIGFTDLQNIGGGGGTGLAKYLGGATALPSSGITRM